MSDVLVNVENVSKRFCRSLKRSLWNGLRDLGSADVQLRPDEF
jgi:lipopolysaccharide transport system ATP-binding protein